MAVDGPTCNVTSRTRLREIHNLNSPRLQQTPHKSTPDTRAFCKSTFVNSARWANELRHVENSPLFDKRTHHQANGELCRSRSAHIPRQRTIETSRPRRSVSWADDLVNVHTYTKPKQVRQSGWQILRKKMSQVMKAIKEDIDF